MRKNFSDFFLNYSLNNGLLSWRGVSTKNNVSCSTDDISVSFNKVVISFDIILFSNELVIVSPGPIGITVDSIVVATNIIVFSMDLVIFTVYDFVVGSIEDVGLDDLAVSENEGCKGEEAHFFHHFVCSDCFDMLWMEYKNCKFTYQIRYIYIRFS